MRLQLYLGIMERDILMLGYNAVRSATAAQCFIRNLIITCKTTNILREHKCLTKLHHGWKGLGHCLLTPWWQMEKDATLKMPLPCLYILPRISPRIRNLFLTSFINLEKRNFLSDNFFLVNFCSQE